VQRLFERRFPATIVQQLPGSSSRSARSVSEQPRASFVTELITHSYPSALNPDPGYEAGQDEQLRNAQDSFVFKRIAKEHGLGTNRPKGGNDPALGCRASADALVVPALWL
jgi:hypothetical protein